MQQLVDLNGDLTNFNLTFTATSQDGSPFEIVVVDQTALDNGNLDFRVANGVISGNIIADKGIYQNYFLVMRAEKETRCDVVIEKREIPQNTQQENNERKNNPPIIQETKSKTEWLKIGAVVAVILIAGFIIYTMNKEKTKPTEKSLFEKLENKMTQSSTVSKNDYTRPERSYLSKQPNMTSNIINKLKPNSSYKVNPLDVIDKFKPDISSRPSGRSNIPSRPGKRVPSNIPIRPDGGVPSNMSNRPGGGTQSNMSNSHRTGLINRLQNLDI